jgi:MoxR-like ATPase
MALKKLYTGSTETPSASEDVAAWLACPPPWRDRSNEPAVVREVPDDERARLRGETFVSTGENEVDCVNLALLLRRPLLVTGDAGIGKSSLAYGIAHALGLGAPLRWEINSRTTLSDGLYSYDAIAHFRAASNAKVEEPLASDFMQLGPLGTAFAPTTKPRVLLIDELDKASFDLPNDLLHILEEGEFRIPELLRQRERARVRFFDCRAPDDALEIEHGRVATRHHPVVVITSNQERDFSNAFNRRCVCLRMNPLTGDALERVVRAQFRGAATPNTAGRLDAGLATDIVLQALFAEGNAGISFDAAIEHLQKSRGS